MDMLKSLLFYLFFAAVLVAATPAAAQTCSDGSMPETQTFSVANEPSFDAQGDIDNRIFTLTFTGPKRIVGININGVDLATVGGSWCNEARLDFDGQVTYTPSFQLAPGPCNDLPSSGNFNLSELGIDYESAGVVTVELYESFDDVDNSVDANYTAGTLTVLGCPTGSTLLPVELVSFTAAATEKHVELDWRTASESENEGFVLERSENGTAWQRIDWIHGFGTTSTIQSYAYTDEAVAPATTYYYRLKQMDFDGTYTYSDIVNVTTGTVGGDAVGQVYPNPVASGDDLRLSLIAGKEEMTTLYLSTIDGKKVRSVPTALVEGRNVVELPTANLTPGLHALRFELDGQAVVRKVSVRK